MKKLTALFITLLFLSACTPSEADFKSTVQPTARDDVALAANAMQAIDKLMDEPEKEVKEEKSEVVVEEVVEIKEVELPSQINLAIPFYSQAPDADWGMPWQEACEEASLILAYYYTQNKPLTKEEFKQHVWGLVEWQEEHYKDYIHTSTEQNAEMLRGYFKYDNFEIVDDPTIEDMKRALAAGYPIVAPFAGRVLVNPFFTAPGPYYHVIAIKGYDEKNFITNDVGTRRGENFIYSYENTMSALHDYDPDKDILEGAKNMIIMK